MGKRGPSKASKDAKRKLCENPGAMLEDVLGEEEIDQECHRLEYHWRKRIVSRPECVLPGAATAAG